MTDSPFGVIAVVAVVAAWVVVVGGVVWVRVIATDSP